MKTLRKKNNLRSREGMEEKDSGPFSVTLSNPFLLPFLNRLGSGDLVVRGGGISVFRPCELGGFFEEPDGAIRAIESGIEFSGGKPVEIRYFPATVSPSRFEFHFEDLAGCLTFYPESAERALEALLLERNVVSLEGLEPYRSQQPQWLSDGLETDDEGWKNRIFFLRDGGAARVGIRMQSASFVFECGFPVAHFDFDTKCFRLAEADAGAVAHFDPTSPKLGSLGRDILSHSPIH